MDITRRHALKMLGGAAVAAVVPLPKPEALSPIAPEATYIAEVGRYENIIITSPRTYAIFRSMVGDAMGRVEHFPRLSDLMRAER